MIVSIHQPQYLPYLGFFHKIAGSDLHVMLDDVQFLRRGFQHRARILSPEGARWLTVPVQAGSDALIAQVTISPTEPWQRRHENSVRTSYGRAPFFERYAPSFFSILHRSWDSILELDLTLTRWVLEELGVTTPIVRSSELGVSGTKSERLAAICRAVGGTTYLSGPGGRRYMELDVFDAAGIGVAWQSVASPTYRQLGGQDAFVPDLSILDVLFCCGPDAKSYLERNDD